MSAKKTEAFPIAPFTTTLIKPRVTLLFFSSASLVVEGYWYELLRMYHFLSLSKGLSRQIETLMKKKCIIIHHHHVPGLLQTAAIMVVQSSLSSALLMSSLLEYSFSRYEVIQIVCLFCALTSSAFGTTNLSTQYLLI